MRGRILDIFVGFEFQRDRVKMWELWGIKICFLLTWHIA